MARGARSREPGRDPGRDHARDHTRDHGREARDARDTQSRLNRPGRTHRSLIPRVRLGDDTFGTFAEGFARFMGTARFLGYMSAVIVLWVLWNAPVGPDRPRFDAYPFIFLTLILSLQASYAAPLILLAQNRQEARDRVQLENDRSVAAQSRADTDFLAREIASIRMSVGDLATRDYLRSELRTELRAVLGELLSELDEDRDHAHAHAHDRETHDRETRDRETRDREAHDRGPTRNGGRRLGGGT